LKTAQQYYTKPSATYISLFPLEGKDFLSLFKVRPEP